MQQNLKKMDSDGFSPILTVIDNLANPVEIDEPSFNPSAVDRDHLSYIEAAAASAAAAERALATTEHLKNTAEKQNDFEQKQFKYNSTKKAFNETKKAYEKAISRNRKIKDLLLPRARGKSKFKFGTIMTLIFLGEIALNSYISVLAGDSYFTAIVSFIGVTAAILAVAWLAIEIRRHVDRLTAPMVTKKINQLNLTQFYRDENQRNNFVLMVLIAILGLTVILMTISIGYLRAEYGSSLFYGIFSGVTLIGAAAACFINYDPISIYLENLEKEFIVIKNRFDEFLKVMVIPSKTALETIIEAGVHSNLDPRVRYVETQFSYLRGIDC